MGLEQNRRFGSGMPKRQEPDGDNSPVSYELSGYKVHAYSLNMALHLKKPQSLPAAVGSGGTQPSTWAEAGGAGSLAR